MGELFINANGASGISDDITAKKNDVLKGKTAVTADSDDEIVEGTLELTGNASAGNVEAGKTFYNTNAHSRQTGALRNVTNDTSVKHAPNNTTKVIRGDAAYVSVNTDGVTRAQIRFNETRGVIEPNTLIGVPQGTIAKAGGLTEGKLLKGQSAFGLTGTATGDATSGAGDILSGKTAYANGNKVTGTMPNRGAVNQSLNASGSYTIPAGYHNGQGKVTANNLSSQTSANASASHILSGKTAWVNGSKVTGTMPNIAAIDTAKSVGWDNDYGYIRMSGGAHITNATSGYPEVKAPYQNVTVTPTTSKQTISPSDYSGKLLGNVFINPIPNNRGQWQYGAGMGEGNDSSGDYYAINAMPEGYYTSNGAAWAPEARITKAKLREHLGITADKIKAGESIAYVNGSFTSDANAGAEDILHGKTAYVNGSKVTGNMYPIYENVQGDLRYSATESGFPMKTAFGAGMRPETFFCENSSVSARNLYFYQLGLTPLGSDNIIRIVLMNSNNIVTISDVDGTKWSVQGYASQGKFDGTTQTYLCGFFYRWPKTNTVNDSSNLFCISSTKIQVPFPAIPGSYYPLYASIFYR